MVPRAAHLTALPALLPGEYPCGLCCTEPCLNALHMHACCAVQAVLARYGIPEASFGPVCVIVDKMEKIPREKASLVGLVDVGAALGL